MGELQSTKSAGELVLGIACGQRVREREALGGGISRGVLEGKQLGSGQGMKEGSSGEQRGWGAKRRQSGLAECVRRAR